MKTVKLEIEEQERLKKLLGDASKRIEDKMSSARKESLGIFHNKFQMEALNISERVEQAYDREDPRSAQAKQDAAMSVPPQAGLALAKTFARVISGTSVPGVPSIGIKPDGPGAAMVVDDQRRINRLLQHNGEIREAFSKAFFNGLFETHYGVCYMFDKEKPVDKRAWVQAFDALTCGYEPRLRRFSWISEEVQWGKLSSEERSAFREGKNAALKEKARRQKKRFVEYEEPSLDRVLQRIKVWHKKLCLKGLENFKKVSYSIFLTDTERDVADTTMVKPEVYIHTAEEEACCLVIGSTSVDHPGGDIPYPEVTDWLPTLSQVVVSMQAVNMEQSQFMRIRLFNKKAMSREDIQEAYQDPVNGIIWLGLNVEEYATGVSSQARPIESDTNMTMSLTAYSHNMTLLQIIAGVDMHDFGDAPSPRKSATESNNIVQSSRQRRAERLQRVAGTMRDVFKVHHRMQRTVYGETIVTPHGIQIRVPNPEEADYVMRVDAVELGHLDTQADIQAQMNWLSILTNIFQVFQGQPPAALRMQLGKIAHIMGDEDLADYFGTPASEDTPQDRVVEMLLGGATELRIEEEDDPAVFMMHYRRAAKVAKAAGRMSIYAAINTALEEYGAIAAERAEMAQAVSQAQTSQPPSGPQPTGGAAGQLAFDLRGNVG